MLKLFLVTGAGLLILSVLALLARKFGGLKPEPTGDAATPSGPPPFGKRAGILSDAEIAFYHTLAAVVQNRSLIFAQVPLNRLVEILPNTTSRQSWLNKIDRKTIDFVLCDPQTLTPQLAIELDDRTHQQANRKERDAFVEEALAAAGFPLLRVPQRAKYDTAVLENDIRARIRKTHASL